MLYDFEGDRPSGELVVYTDEILTVTRTVGAKICKACSYCLLCICFLIFAWLFVCFYFLFFSCQDVGEGWWEGISPDGSRGLFPEAYVEVKFR